MSETPVRDGAETWERLREAVAACVKVKSVDAWGPFVAALTADDHGELAADTGQLADDLLPLREVRGGARRADDLLRIEEKRARKFAAKMREADRERLRLAGPDEVAHDDGEEPPDLPIGFVVPEGYTIGGGGAVWKIVESDEDGVPPRFLLVARRWIGLTGASIDTTTGERHVDATWQDEAGQYVTRSVARVTIADSRAIVSLANAGAPVSSVNAKAVVEWLGACEAAADLTPTRACRAFGWTDAGRTFMWGATSLGAEVKLHADEGTAYHARPYRSGGTFDGWREVWREVAPYPRVALAVYASLSPILLGVVPEACGFVVDWAGRTTGGKTTALKVAASVWGSPEAIQSWNTTAAGMERYAALHRFVPVLADDTNQVRGDRERVAGIIYLVTGLRGRLRASIDGLRASAELRTVLLSTGEAPATSFTEEAGARARTLSLVGLPFGQDSEEARAAGDRISCGVLDHHGHLGPAVVEWLLAHRDAWPVLAVQWRARRDALAAGTGPEARAAQYLATLETVAEWAAEACGLEVHAGALAEARKGAATSVQGTDRALSALNDVLAWLAANPGRLHVTGRGGEPPDVVIAVVQLDEGATPRLGLNPHELSAALKRIGHHPEDVLTEWARRGWTEKARIRVGGRAGMRFHGLRFTDACPVVRDTLRDTLLIDGD